MTTLGAALVVLLSARLAALDGYPVLLQQSRNTAEARAGAPYSVAENFSLAAPTVLTGLRFNGSLYDWDQDRTFPQDRITVRFLRDSGEVPGSVVVEQVGLPAERTATGYWGVFGSHEYLYSIEFREPVVLAPGGYFVEISNDWGDAQDDFFWFGGALDERRGRPNSAHFFPQTGWQELPFEMSLELLSRDMFLLGQRFKIEVAWSTNSANGPGKPLPVVSENSGFFWFFGPENWEMLVKVIDGCGLNDRFWVFFAATTDVGFTLTVTDTQTGIVKTYSNTLGTPADAVTDTAAFATCDG